MMKKTFNHEFSSRPRRGARRLTAAALVLFAIIGTSCSQKSEGEGAPRGQLTEGESVMRSSTVTNPTQTPRDVSAVFVNEEPLGRAELRALEQMYHTRIPAGRYWYDRVSGACGREGGPALSFLPPGLSLGGPLRADASRGRTGVFVNGRELHELDVLALRQFMPVYQGRYWVDAWGNGGYEGGPAFFNLIQIIQASGHASGGGGGRRGSALSTWDRTGVAVFGW